MQTPKVTIYIPVYNYGKYVERAIESVLRQTLSTWELLVINDGSTDETEKILKKYEHHERITIVNQENKGLTVTCNIALRLAQGEYFMRLDGDDYLDENALLVMAHYLDNHPHIGLVFPDYYLVDEHDAIVSIERREKVVEGMLLDMPAHGACTMFRRKILLEMGGYNESILCQDGYDIWLKFIELYKVGNVNLPLFYYRQHFNNLTKNTEKILETRREIKRKFAELKRKKENKGHVNKVAIIPARLHSDVMTRMALVPLNDKPMINHTLDEALKSECFKRIVVVSEDEQILQYVNQAYPQVFTVQRPKELARRNTRIENTVELVLKELEAKFNETYEEGMLLYLESPLKRSEHIVMAIDTMHIFETDSVISLCETYTTFYIRGKNGLERIGSKESFKLERDIVYKGNNALLAFKTKNLKGGRMHGEKIGHITMLGEDSIDIITPTDLKIADFVLKERHRKQASIKSDRLMSGDEMVRK